MPVFIQKPIVSITIPTYNRVYLLKPTVEALLKQIETYSLHNEVELVISDNCSTDGTEKLIREFIALEKYRIVYSKNEQNLGVIKNILRLVELSNASYWMFYGDDDVIPEGSLLKLVNGFKSHGQYPAFMYTQLRETDEFCGHLKSDTSLSINALAKDYFYYVGNAGVFAVQTNAAKEVVKKYTADLVNTCWPQTLILFLAVHNHVEKNVLFQKTDAAIPPAQAVVISNSYYIFETILYALLRTAVSFDKITQQNIIGIAVNSIYGIKHFEELKQRLLEGYCFYDQPKQQEDFKKAVVEAHKTIPKKYRNEIDYLYRRVIQPKLFLELSFYADYLKETKFGDLKTSFINKIKIMSPFGFRAIMRHRKQQREEQKKAAMGIEVGSNNGYF